MSDKISGKIKWYNFRKGYGFIEREDGGKDVFLHATAVKAAGIKQLEEGHPLSFVLEDGPKGPSAINLTSKKEG